MQYFITMFNFTWLATNGTWYGSNFTTAVNESDDDVFTASEKAGMMLCHGFLGAVGFLENLVVVLVTLKNRIMLDCPGNWFVLSLAVGDALMCIVVNLLVNINFLSYQKVPFLATVFRFFILSTCGNLFMLTFNRFLSLCNSLRYPAQMTIVRAKCLTLLPWSIAFFICASYDLVKPRGSIGSVYYCALISSIIALNIYIFKHVRDKSKVTKRLELAVCGPKPTSYREHLLAVRLMIVSFTFFVSFIPIFVFGRIYNSSDSPLSKSFIRIFIWYSVAFHVNAIVNPLVYSTNHLVFRRYFVIIRNRLCRRNVVTPINLWYHEDRGAVAIYSDRRT